MAEFDKLAEKVNNWGRWGHEDERGTLNLITPDVVRKASSSVVTGETYSLAMGLSLNGPQIPGTAVPGRINPVRTMLAVNTPMLDAPDACAYSDDIVVTPTQAATHWDALSHCSHRGVMYNGIPANEINAFGATRLGIEAAGDIVSRGVLLDVARHQGVERLPGKFAVTREILEAVEQSQGVSVEEGDIVLIRTGQAAYFLEGDVPRYRSSVPALEYDAPLYFHERGAAAVAIDNMPMELLPSHVTDLGLPVHVLCLIMMGMIQGQNWVLEDLAAACASDGRYTFLLNATPEKFLWSTGGMVHPVAVR
ncbi:cyclase family protein [Streptomyces sp. NPDC102364]|uniref:cyclase family protein n=1 Tax=Streptomyces sp. NPDC102364 TaxID=3366161 RepID=UPI00382BE50A